MNIIGITEGHTCTAALMKNGEIIACVSEERLTRKKTTEGYPINSLNYLLTFIDKKDIDLVACASENLSPEVIMVDREWSYSVDDHLKEQREHFYPVFYEGKDPIATRKNYFSEILKQKGDDSNYEWENFKISGNPKEDIPKFREIRINTIKKHLGIGKIRIIFLNHHKAHANYAYYASPFRDKDCLVLTMDGMGDTENSTVSIVKNNEVQEIFRTDKCNIGRIWRYITLLLGMKPNQHEYKVMGLAPYADPNIANKAYKIFNEHLVNDGFDFKYKKIPTDLYFYFKNLLEGIRFDGIAGGLQKWTEEIITQWVKNIVDETGINRIVFSGGLSMNIKVNKAIHEMPEVKEFYVAPSGGDESLAIGVCYMATNDNPKPLTNIYLGPEFSDDDMRKVISEKYDLIENMDLGSIAKELKEGKTIGICSGRMEFGARALGNRSIIANPSRPEILRKLNVQIKKRDFWMPFAPSILKEREKDYIINHKNLMCPFMTLAFDSTDLAKKELVSAIHPYDRTVRPQIVEEKNNPKYYKLIKEFEKLTGIGGVLNTSFNLHGDPIICSPKDAIYTMDNSGIDILLLNYKIALKRK